MDKHERFRQDLAALTAKIAIADARVMSNPRPYLNELSELCGQLMKVIDDIDYALSPDCVFDFWDESANKNVITRPADINGEALIRCNRAKAVIRAYRQQN